MSNCAVSTIVSALAFIRSGSIQPAIAEDMMSRDAEGTQGLRRMVLATSPRELGLTPTKEHPRVWGLLMETGYPEAAATLVALLDGTVSLYVSNGGGIIGVGEHGSVRRAAIKFIGAAEPYVEEFQTTNEYPLPKVGRVKFYILTYSGVLTGEFDENLLGEDKHKLSKLFYAGHDVITAIREVEERLPP